MTQRVVASAAIAGFVSFAFLCFALLAIILVSLLGWTFIYLGAGIFIATFTALFLFDLASSRG